MLQQPQVPNEPGGHPSRQDRLKASSRQRGRQNQRSRGSSSAILRGLAAANDETIQLDRLVVRGVEDLPLENPLAQVG